ncbi:MAG: PAS domain S-box protein, partial [Candidatus Lokiarchaeota archaeon]
MSKKNNVLGSFNNFILENIDELVFIIDEDYLVEYINKNSSLSDILGFQMEDLMGNSIRELMNTSSFIKLKDFLNKKIKTLNSSIKIKLKNKSNEFIEFYVKFQRFKEEDDKGKSLLIFKPIPEKSKLQNYLMKQEKDLKDLTKHIPEIRFWKLFTPKEYDEALESSYEMLSQVMENIPQHILWKDKVIKSGKPELHKIELWKDKIGENIILDTNRIPMRDSKGRVVGILVTYEDITEKLIAEEKLKQSEKKYRHLVESSPYGIALINKNGIVIDCNTSINNFLSVHEKNELIGKSYKEIFSFVKRNKSLLPLLEEKLRIFTDRQKEISFEFQLYQTKGNKIWVSLYATNVKFYNENLIQVILQDITEEKLYENLIKKINNSFLNFTTDIRQNISSLLSSSVELLNGNLSLYINKIKNYDTTKYMVISQKGFTNYIDSKIFKELLLSEFFTKDREKIQTNLNLEKKKHKFLDIFFEDLEVKSCISEIIGPQEELNGLVIVFFPNNQKRTNQDKLVLSLICNAIEIEQQRWEVKNHLQEQNIKLSELNQLKTDLLSRTSHELKTPLISIKGFTELLLTIHKDELNENIIEILVMIERGSNRLEKLINTILKASKLEHSGLDLKKENTEISDLVRECILELKGLIVMRKHNISLGLQQNLVLNI